MSPFENCLRPLGFLRRLYGSLRDEKLNKHKLLEMAMTMQWGSCLYIWKLIYTKQNKNSLFYVWVWKISTKISLFIVNTTQINIKFTLEFPKNQNKCLIFKSMHPHFELLNHRNHKADISAQAYLKPS